MGEYADMEIDRAIDEWDEACSSSKWRCKDGRVIEISAMDDRHLKNTIAMLDRKFNHFQVALNAMRKELMKRQVCPERKTK